MDKYDGNNPVIKLLETHTELHDADNKLWKAALFMFCSITIYLFFHGIKVKKLEHRLDHIEQVLNIEKTIDVNVDGKH